MPLAMTLAWDNGRMSDRRCTTSVGTATSASRLVTSTEVSDPTKALTMAGLAEARSKAARSRRASSPASVGAKIPSESPGPNAAPSPAAAASPSRAGYAARCHTRSAPAPTADE